MRKMKVYVGRTSFALVLKYPVGGSVKEYCRFLPVDEEDSKTAYYLKLELKKKGVEFLPLINEDENHGIKPAKAGELERLAEVYGGITI